MTDPNKVVETLRAALSKMNDNGAHWIKHRLFDRNLEGEEMFCALGAIFEVTGMPVADYVKLLDEGASDEIFADFCNKGNKQIRLAAVKALAQAVPSPVPSPAWSVPEGEHGTYHVITYWNDRQVKSWDAVRDVFAKAEQIAKGAPEKEES